MVKAQKGEGEASSKSERDDKQVGGDKAKIAQLEEEKSKLGRSAPDVTPHAEPRALPAEDQPQHRDKSLLALRDPTPKQHELTPETADLSLPHAADGEMPLPSHAARGNEERPARTCDNAKRVKLALHRQGLRVPVRRRRRRRAAAGAADALDAAGEVPEAPGARAVGRSRTSSPR